MNDCYFEKKDWRACKKEVRLPTVLGIQCPFFIYASKDRSLYCLASMLTKSTLDGGIQRMLEETGQRSKDRHEGYLVSE